MAAVVGRFSVCLGCEYREGALLTDAQRACAHTQIVCLARLADGGLDVEDIVQRDSPEGR